MRYGVWTPLPHTIRPEPAMESAIADASVAGRADGADKALDRKSTRLNSSH